MATAKRVRARDGARVSSPSHWGDASISEQEEASTVRLWVLGKGVWLQVRKALSDFSTANWQ
jgi:hypothetical protein